MNTAEKIKYLRESRGLSQDQLAKEIGVDRTTIVKYESGGSKPTRYIQKLADFFHVSTDYLLGREESGPDHYYLDDDTRRRAEEMRTRPGLRVLFDASRRLTPENIKAAQDYVEFLRAKQHPDDDAGDGDFSE